MKSIPFKSILAIPHNIKVGDKLHAGGPKITEIHSIEFVDAETIIVIGLCRNI